MTERPITEYMIVDAESADFLFEQVQELLDRGWEPLGGVSVYQDTRTRTIYPDLPLDPYEESYVVNVFLQAIGKRGS